ncbi:MAG: tRNA lysidine(34) synthetase TilS, partial [Proteobacteria bacterium]|nr:tRNA lysidine(34) synthetase TilS [Pseudomonadota bacterium]
DTEGLALGTRRGGERLRLDPDGPSRPLKDWLREARLPPWARARALLVRERGALVAVVLPHATWIAAERRSLPDCPGLVLEWQGAPEELQPAGFVERPARFR